MAHKNRLLVQAFSEVVGEEQALQISKGIDIIGDIAILKSLPEVDEINRKLGESLIRILPSIKTVLRQSSAVQGEYRLRDLEWLAGEKKKLTIHKEFGCIYRVDVAKAYFSPRLSTERDRVAKDIGASFRGQSEVIVNMFAGVGSFSILIAKRVKAVKIYSIDINPDAVYDMVKNIRLNKVSKKVTACLGDAQVLIDSLFHHSADRILMPLPERAHEFLPLAIKALKKSGGVIYYETFLHANKGEDPVQKAEKETRKLVHNFDYSITGRVIREVGPFWFQIAQDIRLTMN
ncbi:class I SAM-dependent methyltransferase [[Eubacterium] cellulosolvens]